MSSIEPRAPFSRARKYFGLIYCNPSVMAAGLCLILSGCGGSQGTIPPQASFAGNGSVTATASSSPTSSSNSGTPQSAASNISVAPPAATVISTTPSNVALSSAIPCGSSVSADNSDCTFSYTLSGVVSGLLGSGLVLQVNGAGAVPVTTSGTLPLATLPSGSPFIVTILTQPVSPAQTCLIQNSSGTVSAGTKASVTIDCAHSPFVTAVQFAARTFRGFSAPGDTSVQSTSDLAATGANLVRVFLALDQSGNTYYVDPGSLVRLNAVIAAGTQLGFKVIICLQPPDNTYFTNPALLTSLGQIWLALSKQFKTNTTVGAYDLINEPISPPPGGANAWVDIATAWISSIRTNDPNHVIVFEPSPGGLPESFVGLKPLPFPNIVYSTHMYEPYAFAQQGLLSVARIAYPTASSPVGPINKATVSQHLQPVRDFAAETGAPIYVGEFSAVRWAPNDSSNSYISDLITLFEAEGYSWTYNSWRNYQGWDAEMSESWFYNFPFVSGMPDGFAVVWPPPRTQNTDTMNVLRAYFAQNLH